MKYAEKAAVLRRALASLEATQQAAVASASLMPDTPDGRSMSDEIWKAWHVLRAVQKRMIVDLYDLEAVNREAAPVPKREEAPS